MLSNDLTSIAILLVSLAGTVAAGFIVWFLKEKVGESRINKVNEMLKRYNIEWLMKQSWVQEAVRYAEQELWDKTGQQKYDAVMEFVSKKAKEHGIDLSPSELKVLIEAQLHKMKEGFRDGWTSIETQSSVIVTPPDSDARIINELNNLND